MSKWTMAILLASMSATGCFADDSTATGSAAGSGGVGGTGGGVGGTGGSGATGTGGSGGTGGSSADSGTSSGGSAGTAGSGGTGGSAGAAGSAGSGGSAGTGGSAGSAGSGGAGTAGASGAAGAAGAGMDAGCVQGTGPAALPFAVDEFFTASGWMGDVGAIRLESCGTTADGGTSDAGSSDGRAPDASATDASATDARAPDAGLSDGGRIATAKCWAVTYSPTADGGQGWAGVDWQFPANNWGTMNGRVIPRGAKRVRFYAWGAVGGEVVSFNVGYGFTSPDMFGMTLANQILTTTPTAYEIDLTGIEYTCPSVRMGFGWTTAGALPLSFYIDDVEWQ